MFKLYCRVFQALVRLVALIMIWRQPELLEGEGCVGLLPSRLKEKGIKNILLVTDKVVFSLGLADGLLLALKEAGINAEVYDKTVPNPTIDNIEEALATYKDKGCDAIVAFGGGSAMDCAKGVGARVARPDLSIPLMKGLLKVGSCLPPLVAVPTTAGTGSEATVAAVVVDSGAKEKYAIMDPELIPRIAVLDPLLTVRLPPSITAMTGMDALTHAVEAYIGRGNIGDTREMARKSVKLVFDNLHAAYKDGSDIAARANMQRAAYCGGLAFTRAYVGNVHALAHALGGRYGIAHGLANAVILPHVLDDYGECVYKPLAELADVVGVPGETAERKAKAFIASVRDLNASIGIPATVYGIKEEDIPDLASHAFKEANPSYPVPRIFSRDDFSSLCLRLMGKSGLHGYAGKMARIDLTSGEVSTFMPPRDELYKYLGGKGLAANIIYDAFAGKVDAFAEENLIVISTSPLNLTKTPSSSRFNISTISPLTGLLVSSNCGGPFGLHLKRAGFDALVISGKAPSPAYIRIGKDTVELCDAAGIWGKTTSEAQEMMGTGGKLAIGPAGENLVLYANVASGERAAGRGGVGAVFGHKLLKGLVAESKSNEITVSDSEGLKDLSKKWVADLKKHPITGQQLPQLGTAALVRTMQKNSQLATKNFADGRFDGFEGISGERLRDDLLVKNKGCTTCPIQCMRVVTSKGREVKGPELETIGSLGANLMNPDLELIASVNHLCDEYGMDTISFGGSVGFAMELAEKGLWENGLSFGNCEGLEALAAMVAGREGIGADIAEGVMRMSERYGGRESAMHVKGMELPAYDPRAAQGMGLGYATANRGGCHLNGGYLAALEGLGLRVNGATTRGKAALTMFFQDMTEAISAAGICLFTTYEILPSFLVRHPDNVLSRIVFALIPHTGGLVAFLHNHPGLLGASSAGLLPHPRAYWLITGRKTSMGRFLRAGERIFNLERLVNIRQGLRDGDTLPDRLKSPLQRDPTLDLVRLAPMLKRYYRIRGWDEHGVPKKRRLAKLGLSQKALNQKAY